VIDTNPMAAVILLSPPTLTTVALARAAVAEAATDTADLATLLDALGLGPDAGPRIRLADLAWRPDRHIRRAPGVIPLPPVRAHRRTLRGAA
jgi:hypothetical protein